MSASAAVLLFGNAVMAAPALAQEKIAVLNLRQIVQESDDVKKINEKLKAEFGPREDDLKKSQEKLRDDVNKFRRDNASMNKTDREQLEKKIMDSQQKIQQTAQTLREELTKKQNEQMQKFLQKVEKIVDDIAAQKKYDLILQGEGVVFAKTQMDITNEVMKMLQPGNSAKKDKNQT